MNLCITRFFAYLCVMTALLPVAFGTRTDADDLSFTVSPMTTELSLLPGVVQTQTLTVKDDRPPDAGAVPLRLKAYAMDWTLDPEGNPRFATAGDLPASCSLWTQINPEEVSLLPGQTQTVRCTLRIPPDAQGTFHTMLMFQAAPTPAKIRHQIVAISGRIGASLYVSVGPQARRARITALTVTPQKTLLTVENTGTCQIRLKGTLKICAPDGRQVAQISLPVTLVLPGADSTRNISLDTPVLPAGVKDDMATVLLDYGGDVLMGARSHVTAP